MNNARFLEEEIVVDTTVLLRERKAQLTKIIEAVDGLAKNKDWQTIRALVYEGLTDKTEKSLQAEAKKNELNAPEIYRLQGKLEWAKRYSDIYKLAETYKSELNNITKKLNEKGE